MSTTSPLLDAGRWARLKDHVADIGELEPERRRDAIAQLSLDDDDRIALGQLLAPLLAGDKRLQAPHPDARANSQGAMLRYAPGETVGRFRIEGLLGRGGMGEVYEARSLDGGAAVALKVLRSGLAQQDYAKFSENEQRALQRLDDVRIAKFIEAFSVPQVGACLILELVDGEPLLTYCRGRHYNVEARLKLFIEVCNAVASAHQQLVVHRDLKPSNVLVTPEGQVKLLDFGVAKLLDDPQALQQTQTHGGLFTLAYAAPEQILRQPVSTATDVFALGGLLYRLLVDVSPYASEDPESLINAVLHEPPQRLTAAVQRSRLAGNRVPAGTMDRDLDRVLQQAMEKAPANRYRTALELAADVGAVLDGRPIRAGGGTLYRAFKYVRRHRALVASAGVMAMALVVATVVSLLFAQRAQLHAHRAQVANDFLLTALDISDRFSANNDGAVTLTEVLERTVAQARIDLADEPDVLVDVLHRLSYALQHQGRLESAMRAARDAHRLALQQGQRTPTASTAQRLASLQMETGELDDAQRLLFEALDWLEGSDAPQGLWIRVYISLGKLASTRGDATESLRWYREVVALREGLAEDQQLELPMDYNNLATGLYNLNRFAEADAAYARAIDLLRQRLGENHPRLGVLLYGRSMTLMKMGRFDEARRELATTEAALNAGRVSDASKSGPFNSERGYVWLDVLTGEYSSGLQRLNNGVLADAQITMPLGVGPLLTLRGTAELGAGDSLAALASFTAAERNFVDTSRERHEARWYAHGLMGVARAATGDIAQGDRELDEAIRELSAHGLPSSGHRVDLDLYAGTAARRRNDLAAARDHHRRAGAMQEQLGWLGGLGAALVQAELALDDLQDAESSAAIANATLRLSDSIDTIRRIAPNHANLKSLLAAQNERRDR
jgi:tetratricopeptide (TPR) repeat protein